MRPTVITACLNGARLPGSHPRLPLSMAAIVADAVAVSAAGAGSVHVHARGADGAETLDPAVVDETVRLLRKSCPDVRLSIGVSAATEPDPVRRARLVALWSEPTSVVVRLSEPGYAEVSAAALDSGLAVEVAAAAPADVQRLVRAGLADEVSRVFVAPGGDGVAGSDQVVMARAIEQALDAGAVRAPRVHHGFGPATWDVLAAAILRGRDIGIGLEGTLTMPDGRPAPSNAALVRAARKLTSPSPT